MSDITLCVNKGCPLRAVCKRGEEGKDEHQSYAMFFIEENLKCSDYIPKLTPANSKNQ